MSHETMKPRPPTMPTTPKKQPCERSRATERNPDRVQRVRAGGGYRIIRNPRVFDAED